MVTNVLRRVVPVVRGRTCTCPTAQRWGHGMSSSGCWHSQQGYCIKSAFLERGGLTGTFMQLTRGRNQQTQENPRVAPCGTLHRGPELGHGDLGFCRFCHRHVNCSWPQDTQRKTASGKRLSLRVNKCSCNWAFGHLS